MMEKNIYPHLSSGEKIDLALQSNDLFTLLSILDESNAKEIPFSGWEQLNRVEGFIKTNATLIEESKLQTYENLISLADRVMK